jgi:hypothetical protein
MLVLNCSIAYSVLTLLLQKTTRAIKPLWIADQDPTLRRLIGCEQRDQIVCCPERPS